jgi:hypothetical protein
MNSWNSWLLRMNLEKSICSKIHLQNDLVKVRYIKIVSNLKKTERTVKKKMMKLGLRVSFHMVLNK